MNNVALITGSTGQDGAYLAKLLLERGYIVYGGIRRGGSPKYARLNYLGITDKINFVELEITEFSNVFDVIRDIKPDIIFNLAAQSFVSDSFHHPITTTNVDYVGVLNLLENIRILNKDIRFYQASTSEMYGDVLSDPQDENTPFNPMSPYAVAKCAAHQLCKNYRTAYGMHLSCGILFNHESELRGREFVTRKITLGAAELTRNIEKTILLGNLNSVRDWGYAPDFVRAMILMVEANKPDDFVVATNKITSVREFLEMSLSYAGFDPIFEGETLNEICLDKKTGRILAKVDKKYYRPSDVTYLRGDYGKINKTLGWSPYSEVSEICQKMVQFDLDNFANDGI